MIIWIDNQEVEILEGKTKITCHHNAPFPLHVARFPFDVRAFLPDHVEKVDRPTYYWLGNLCKRIKELSGKQLELFEQ